VDTYDSLETDEKVFESGLIL